MVILWENSVDGKAGKDGWGSDGDNYIQAKRRVEKIEFFFLSADLALLLVMSQSARIGYRTGGSIVRL